jgi:putative restriction endonuclease
LILILFPVQGDSLEDRIRASAFAYVARLEERGNGFVRSRDLRDFSFDGNPMPLLALMKGIRVLPDSDVALTIMTTFSARPEDRPYEDDLGLDGYPRYKRMRGNPDAKENRALRNAMALARPLIWFYGVGPAVFRALYPVWLVDEEDEADQFVVALSEDFRAQWDRDFGHPEDELLHREYALTEAKRRLHQPRFRHRVLTAYAQQCALCRLRHPPLLDAAHIREDADGGEPIVPNGVAMCAIHHRAFDSSFLGIRPDYVIEIREDIRDEIDGPTLLHALQGVHGSKLELPRSRPSWPRQDLLEERYERFRTAS